MIESVRTWALLRELRASRSPDQLAALQDRLLRAAVAHVFEEVPFYRRLWGERDFDAAGFRGLRDLAEIPILSTEEARRAVRGGELVAGDADLLRAGRFQTSGSSGAPLRIPRGPSERRLWRASGLRAWLEHGYRWSDVTLRFDSQAGPGHPLQRLGISRTVWVSNELPLQERVRRLQATRPDVVVGTPTVLRGVCAALEARPGGTPKPRTVFSQGEVLDARTLGAIERVLGVAPIDLYGLTEIGYVAWQCERRDALHVNAEAFLVEVLRDTRPAGPGELGRVVITDLRGRTLPLLRYDTGDLAVAAAEPCGCGRSVPVLHHMEGRADATIARADGSVLTTRSIADGLGGVLPPDRYCVSQDREGRVSLDLVPGEREELAAETLRALVGGRPLSVSRTFSVPHQNVEKTHPVRSAAPLSLP
jgi:phenylacetate-CoA ligase